MKAGRYKFLSTFVVGIMVATTFLVLATPVSVSTVFANAGNDQVVDVGASVNFDGTGTLGAGTIEYTWYFRDGNTVTGSNPQPTHTYTTEGIYEVGLLAKDSNGYYDLDTVQITVKNFFPIADGGNDRVVNEDDTVDFDASASSDLNNDIVSYEWDFGDDTPPVTLVTTQNVYEKAGIYHTKLTVTDNDGAYDVQIISVTVNNVVPGSDGIANGEIDDELTVYEDDTVTFDASQSVDTPSDMPLLRYAWDFGDGCKDQGIATTHTYTIEGIYTATLTVTDDNNATSQDDITINVLNVPPTVNAGADQTVHEGDTVFFDGSGSLDTPSDEPLLDYSWSFGKNGIHPTYAWYYDSINDVVLEVTDDDGEMNSDTATVTVLNSPPTAGVVAAYILVDFRLRASGEKWHDVRFEIYEGSALNDYLQVTRYPGDPDDQAVSKEIKVSVAEEATGAVFYTPLDDPVNGQPNGATPVWLTLTFEDGTEYVLFHSFNVQKPDEWIWEIDFASFLAGKKIHFDGSVYEPGTDDITIEWNLGDGTIITKDYPYDGTHPVKIIDSVEHTYTSTGLFTLEFTAEDDNNGVGIDTVMVESQSDGISVDNLAPSAYASADKLNAMEDEGIDFNGMGKDSSSDIKFLSYHWDFRDGTTATSSSFTHIYEKAGVYAAVLTVTDDSGEIGRDSVTIVVENAEPLADLNADKSMINEDEIVNFDASNSWDTASDMPLLTYGWDFGDGSKSSGIIASHEYTKNGVFAVTLTIQDDDGAVSIETTTITVVNPTPFDVVVTAKQTVDEDEIIFFAGSALDTPSDEVLLGFVWDFDDGNEGYGRNPTHSYSLPGIYTVKLTVTDDDMIAVVKKIEIIVNNVDPVAFAGATLIKAYGPEITIEFEGRGFDSATDQPTLSYEWDLGDGNFEYSPTVTINLNATKIYEIFFKVEDIHLSTTASIQIRIDFTLDSDGDLLTDEFELNPANDLNPFSWDTDGDDLTDYMEVYTYPTDPSIYDTDSDGMNDWEEITFLGTGDIDGDGITNPLDWDSDGDLIRDGNDPNPGQYTNPDGSAGTYTHIAILEDTAYPSLIVSVIFSYNGPCGSLPSVTRLSPGTVMNEDLGLYVSISSSCSVSSAQIRIKYDYRDLPTYAIQYKLAVYKWSYSDLFWRILENTGVDAANNIVWGITPTISQFGIGNSAAQDSDDDGLSDWEEKGTHYPATFRGRNLLVDTPLDTDDDGAYGDEDLKITNSGGNWADLSNHLVCSGTTCSAVASLVALGFDLADLTAGYSWYLKLGTNKLITIPNVYVYASDIDMDIQNGIGTGFYLYFEVGTHTIDYYELTIHAESTLNPLDEDTDNDGLEDGEEIYTSPLDLDTDDDGFLDGYDWDPLVDLKVTVEVNQINQLTKVDDDNVATPWVDESKADFYFRVKINDSQKYKSGTYWNQDPIYPSWSGTYDIPDNEEIVKVEIQVRDDDAGDWVSPEPDEVWVVNVPAPWGPCPGSPYTNYDGELATAYSLKGEWCGYDWVGDPDGYGHVSAGGDADWEAEMWFNIKQNDYDGDGLTYWKEMDLGLNPKDKDSDNDGMRDDWELLYDLDPNINTGDFGASGNPDQDGLTNWQEYTFMVLSGSSDPVKSLNPTKKDTDGDGIWDGFEYNVYHRTKWDASGRNALLDPTNEEDAETFVNDLKPKLDNTENLLEEAQFWLNKNKLSNAYDNSFNRIMQDFKDMLYPSLQTFSDFLAEIGYVTAQTASAAGAAMNLGYADRVLTNSIVWGHLHNWIGAIDLDAVDPVSGFPLEHSPGYIYQVGYGTQWSQDIPNKLPSIKQKFTSARSSLNMVPSVPDAFQNSIQTLEDVLDAGKFGGQIHQPRMISVPLKQSDGSVIYESVSDGGYDLEHDVLDIIERLKYFIYTDRYIGHACSPPTPFTNYDCIDLQDDVLVSDAAYDYIWVIYKFFASISANRELINGLMNDDPL
jgi:PKD repeat protein